MTRNGVCEARDGEISMTEESQIPLKQLRKTLKHAADIEGSGMVGEKTKLSSAGENAECCGR